MFLGIELARVPVSCGSANKTQSTRNAHFDLLILLASLAEWRPMKLMVSGMIASRICGGWGMRRLVSTD
jgi:hypothetical protein